MFSLRSLTGRIFIGEMIGLLVGILVMMMLPLFSFPMFGTLGFGTLLMFILMGAMTGFMGIFDRHPVFDFTLHWSVRGAVIGFTFMLMYILLSFDALNTVMQSSLISWMNVSSPFWALIDGTCIGIFMAFVEAKLAGDGPNLPIK